MTDANIFDCYIYFLYQYYSYGLTINCQINYLLKKNVLKRIKQFK